MALIVEGKTYELISKVAQQLGTTIAALRRACDKGIIPFVRIGRHRLVDLEAAQKFIREHYRANLAAAMRKSWRKRKRRQVKRKS
jgi:excisionase family DNA binding protein